MDGSTYFFRKYELLLVLVLSGLISVQSIAQNSWAQLSNFGGSSRREAVGFSIGSKGYIGLGYDASLILKNDLWEFNPLGGIWTQAASFPGTARSGATAFVIGNFSFVGTGHDSQGMKKDLWRYDPASNSWLQRTDFPGTARENAISFAVGSRGYVGTGNDIGIFNWDFYEYDTTGNSWTQKSNFSGSYGVSGATAFVINNYGYVGLGYDGTQFRSQWWRYNSGSNTWTQVAAMPAGMERSGAFGTGICLKGYVGMGYQSTTGNFNDLWEYNSSTNSWSQLAPFPGAARADGAGFSIGGGLYYGTGTSGGPPYMNDFWKYTPMGDGVIISGPTAVCQGVCFTLNAGPGFANYLWSTGAASQSISACTPGTYTVTVTDACGLTSTATVVVTGNPLPYSAVTCSHPYLHSAADSVKLTGSPGYSAYYWKRNGVFIGAATQLIWVKQPGRYSCVVTDANGCTKESTGLRVIRLTYPSDPDTLGPDEQRIVPLLVTDQMNNVVVQNPSKTSFIFKRNSIKVNDELITIEIWNAAGRKISFLKLLPEQNEVESEKLSPGIYFALVKSIYGQSVMKLVLVE